jgi:hypothetical protein
MKKAITIPAIRTFRGYGYDLDNRIQARKNDAVFIAESWRSRGGKALIVAVPGGWAVYKRAAGRLVRMWGK